MSLSDTISQITSTDKTAGGTETSVFSDATPESAAGAADSREHKRLNQPLLLGVVGLVELCIIALAGVATFLIYGQNDTLSLVVLGTTMVVTPFTALFVFQKIWLYTMNALQSAPNQIGKFTLALAGVFGAYLAGAALLGYDVVALRPWVLAWFVASVAILAVLRIGVSFYVRRLAAAGRLVRRTVIVGGGKNAEELIELLDRAANKGIEIVGIFDDRKDDRSPETIMGYKKLGSFEALETFCREQDIDLLIVTLPMAAEARILQLLKMLWVLPVDIRLSATSSRLRFRPQAYSYISNVPVLNLFDKPLTDWDTLLKEVEDRVLGTLLLILAAPVMALVALAVKWDSRGPVFFTQKRQGFNNEEIKIYKFRSMYVDQADANAAKLVTRDDPRVTRVGRFIRKTSLDELPQLLNVVKGELSLVGPRPHASMAKAKDQAYVDVVDGYYARHKIKPGVTGWAQINGWRGETDTYEKIQRRVEYDLDYIDNWSILFDLYIIALTPISLITTRNAY